MQTDSYIAHVNHTHAFVCIHVCSDSVRDHICVGHLTTICHKHVARIKNIHIYLAMCLKMHIFIMMDSRGDK